MSMILYLRRIDDWDLKEIKNRLSASKNSQTNATLISGLFGSLIRRRKPKSANHDPEPFHIADFFFEDCDEGDLIDFDKAWDALHFMLTGEPSSTEGPLAIMFFKGEEIGSDDGYGPARLIPKEVMQSFNIALKSLSDDDIAKRYDPKAIDDAQLYASDIFADEGDEALDYVMQGIPQLRQFAAKCAMTNSGALVGIY